MSTTTIQMAWGDYKSLLRSNSRIWAIIAAKHSQTQGFLTQLGVRFNYCPQKRCNVGYANAPYYPKLSPTFYDYGQVSDNYGAGFNIRIPAVLFASDYFSALPLNTEAQSALGNKKFYFDSLGGQAIMRSGFDSTSSMVFFACRQDLGGHTYANKNEILFSARGRIWFPRVTTIASGQSTFDVVSTTQVSNSVLVNGLGLSPDTGTSWSGGIVPGKFVHYRNANDMFSVAGDATKAYSYQWKRSPFGGLQFDNPALNPPTVTKVTDNQAQYRYSPFYPYDEIPFYDTYAYTDNTTPPYYYQRIVERPYQNGIMKKVFRTVAMVQAPNPYVLIADDVQRDNNINNYQWISPVSPDLSIDTTYVNLKDNNYQFDIVLKEPVATGKRRLLVRVLNNNGAVSNTVPGTLDSAIYKSTFCVNFGLLRLKLESNSIDPQFKVMLFPFEKGDSLPITDWSADRSKLYVYNKGVRNTISFLLDSAGRTNILLNSPDTGAYWTGAKSTDWHDSGNWSNNKVPTLSDNAAIPFANIANMPVIGKAAEARALSIYKGATLRIDSSLQLYGDLLCDGKINGAGLLATNSVSTTSLPTGKSWSVRLLFNATKGGQTLVAGTYDSSVSIRSATGGTIKAYADIVLNGRLDINPGDTLDMVGNSLKGNFKICSGKGVLATQSVKTDAIPAGIVWGGNVLFNNRLGGQRIPAGTYGSLFVSTNAYATDSAIGDLFVTDSLGISNKATLDMGTALLDGPFNAFKGKGTLATRNVRPEGPFPGGKTWPFLVELYSTSKQTIPPGTYSTLDLSAGANGDRAFGTAGISDTSFRFLNNLLPTKGTVFPNASTVYFMGNNQEVPAIQFHNLDLTKAFAASYSSGEIKIDGDFEPGNALSTWSSGKITFNGTSTQVIPDMVYNHLGIKGTNRNGTIVTVAPSLALTGNLDCGGLSFANGFQFGKGIGIRFVGTGTIGHSIVGRNLSPDSLTNQNPNGPLTFQDSSDIRVSAMLDIGNNKCYINNSRLALASQQTLIGSFSKSRYLATDSLGRLAIEGVNTVPVQIPIGTPSSYAPVQIWTDSLTTVTVGANKYPTYAVGNFSKIVNMQWAISINKTSRAAIRFRFNAADTAKGFSVDSLCEVGIYDTAYSLYNIGKPMLDAQSYYVDLPNASYMAGTPYYHVIGDSGYIKACTPGFWIGLNGGDANFKGNWCGGLPTATTPVVIANTVPKLTADLSFGPTTLLSGIQLNGFSLTVNGPLSGKGTLTGGTGSSLIAKGKGTCYFDQTAKGSTNALKDLTIDAGDTVALGNALNLYGKLTPASGLLSTGNNLTLVSNPTGTARVVAGKNSRYVIGSVTAQLYIPAKSGRVWEYIGSPVSQSIGASWQKQIYITGPGTGGTVCAANNTRYNTNGFDASVTNEPNMLTYDALKTVGSNWSTIPRTNVNLAVGKGYQVRVFGNRTGSNCANQLDSIGFTPPTSVTLSAFGTLQQGNVKITLNTPSLTPLTLLANPYACPISFDALISSNPVLAPKAWVYAPTGNGNFSAYSYGILTNPAKGTPTGNALTIDNGQAFFVEAAGADTIVTFSENHKLDTAIGIKTYFGGANAQLVRVYWKNGNDSVLDESVVRFNANGSKNYIANWDAAAIPGPANNQLSFLKQGKWLSIATRPALSAQQDTMALSVKAESTGTYTLDFYQIVGIDPTMGIYLHDNFLNKDQDLILSPKYVVKITADTNSQGAKRFELRIGKPLPLALRSLQLTGKASGNIASLHWNGLADNTPDGYYELYKSIDGGQVFVPTATFKRNETDSYEARELLETTTVYKVVAFSKGRTFTSNTVTLTPTGTSRTVGIAPNPVHGNFASLLFTDMPQGNYTVSIRDILGKEMLRSAIVHGGGTQRHNVNFKSALATKGTYCLLIVSEYITKPICLMMEKE